MKLNPAWRIGNLLLAMILFLAVAGTASAQNSSVLYGEGFSLKITEPQKWTSHQSDAAHYGVNAYFCLPGYSFNDSPVIMYIRVLNKNGRSVEQNLQQDMDQFAKVKKSILFQDFPVGNLKYHHASKQYLIDTKTIDYLCFIDPDESSPLYAVFVLSGPKETCRSYLNDFTNLIQSFVWMGNFVAPQ